jgi:hypothetical protein
MLPLQRPAYNPLLYWFLLIIWFLTCYGIGYMVGWTFGTSAWYPIALVVMLVVIFLLTKCICKFIEPFNDSSVTVAERPFIVRTKEYVTQNHEPQQLWNNLSIERIEPYSQTDVMTNTKHTQRILRVEHGSANVQYKLDSHDESSPWETTRISSDETVYLNPGTIWKLVNPTNIPLILSSIVC